MSRTDVSILFGVIMKSVEGVTVENVHTAAPAAMLAAIEVEKMLPPERPDITRTPRPNNNGLISDKQRKRMYAISQQHHWNDAAVKKLLADHGFESSKDVTRDKYDAICTSLEDDRKAEAYNDQDIPF